MPSIDIGDTSIQVAINSISAIKLNEKPPTKELVFDIGAKLEEKERKTGKVTVTFILTVGTKPNIVKFGIEGTATLTGRETEIEKQLEIDPETKIPRMLHSVYQRVFMAIYLASTILDTPHPPPDLFYSSKQPTPKVEVSTTSTEATQQETPKETEETSNEAKA